MQKIKLEESKMKGATREEAQVCILCRKGMENVGHVQAECCWQAIWALLVPARLSKVGYKTYYDTSLHKRPAAGARVSTQHKSVAEKLHSRTGRQQHNQFKHSWTLPG